MTASNADALRVRLSVASVFTSAFLLFLLQPMLARLLLPMYGGSPAVWNTCMVFFQVLLLGGYAYASTVIQRVPASRQVALHAAVLVLSLLAIPRAVQLSGTSDAWPVPAIVLALIQVAGVPFFILATNSSLAQHWFARATNNSDPSWLYAASNTGSLAALVAYPLVVEPWFGVSAQLTWWSVGYGLFVVVSLLTLWFTRRGVSPSNDVIPSEARDLDRGETSAPGPRSLASLGMTKWVLRSAVGVSLLLSVTMQITNDVVSAPLLWVVPLAIYLLTFIIVFSRGRRPPRQIVARIAAIGIAISFVLVIVPTIFPLWFALLALLATLFFGALLCHGDLADDRPHASQLASFYLWIAVGGVVGGVLNSIIAPLVFDSVAEYPITLAVLAWMLADPKRERETLTARARALVSHPVTGAMLLAIGAAAVIAARSHDPAATAESSLLRWQFMPVALLTAGVLFASRPDVLATAATLSAAFVMAGLHFVDPVIDRGRSFFGVSRVTENASERLVLHGVTVHGSQRKDPALRDIPTSYYDPVGPLGWVVANARPGATIGVIGLGAGSLAPLTTAGQTVTFYEIDPLVDQIARRDFTYLASTKAATTVRIGDGRQLVDREPDDHFDLLVVDAFNSDAIPTHLLTDEAIAIYLRKLRPDGLVVVHISNRYADLTRVFRAWSQVTGQRVVINEFVPTDEQASKGARATVAVALARTPRTFARLAETKQWFWLEAEGPAVHWTDDHVNLLAVLNKNILKP